VALFKEKTLFPRNQVELKLVKEVKSQSNIPLLFYICIMHRYKIVAFQFQTYFYIIFAFESNNTCLVVDALQIRRNVCILQSM
jgi:hypothetical protein